MKIQEKGYAVDNEEWDLNMRCVAVPVFDFTEFPSHAISVSGPSTRLTDERVNQIVPDLIDVYCVAHVFVRLRLGRLACYDWLLAVLCQYAGSPDIRIGVEKYNILLR